MIKKKKNLDLERIDQSVQEYVEQLEEFLLGVQVIQYLFNHLDLGTLYRYMINQTSV